MATHLHCFLASMHGDLQADRHWHEDEQHHGKRLHLEGLHARLVSGNPIFTERIRALADQQLCIPASQAFWEYLPGNLQAIDFQVLDLPDVKTAYVMPLCIANLEIDDDIADCLVAFLRCCEQPISEAPSPHLLGMGNDGKSVSKCCA